MLQGSALLAIVHDKVGDIFAQMEASGYDSDDELMEAIGAARLFNGEYKDSEGMPTINRHYLDTIYSVIGCQVKSVELHRALQNAGFIK